MKGRPSMAACPEFRFRIVAGAVDGAWARASVTGADAGCVVLFLGTVRERGHNKEVVRLEYEAYAPMAEAELRRIAEELRRRHAILRVAVEHAVGALEPGAASVAVAVAAEHRAPAFAAAADFMDQLKERVPIWKKEVYADGSSWIGTGS